VKCAFVVGVRRCQQMADELAVHTLTIIDFIYSHWMYMLTLNMCGGSNAAPADARFKYIYVYVVHIHTYHFVYMHIYVHMYMYVSI